MAQLTFAMMAQLTFAVRMLRLILARSTAHCGRMEGERGRRRRRERRGGAREERGRRGEGGREKSAV
eukprot:2031423-Rhodomonas_salina.1